MESFKISFLGGASQIGASCSLLQVAGKNILIDCGVRFEKDRPLPDFSMLDNISLDAILITHAHSDHTGGLPAVHQMFPAIPIYMTPPTIDITSVLIRDALKIMGFNLELENEIPLYSKEMAESVFTRTVPAKFYDTFSIDDIHITYVPAGHILGAAMIHLATPIGSILFSGDYSVHGQLTTFPLEVPTLPVDLFVTESTYGNRFHSDRQTSERKLIQSVAETIENSGKVLIPAFAVGRAQEVILIIKRAMAKGQLEKVPVYIDGLVRNVCALYPRYPTYLPDQAAREARHGSPFYQSNITPIVKPTDREKILQSGPCIIIASSGMLTGGPSAFYASKLANDPKNLILITGYQDEESPGRALQNLADKENEEKIVQLNGRSVPFKASLRTYSLSAHADKMQMLNLVNSMSPKTVVLVHGDLRAKEELKKSIGNKDIIIAENGDSIERNYPVSQFRNLKSLNLKKLEKIISENPEDEIVDFAPKYFGFKVSKTQLEVFSSKVKATGLLETIKNRTNISPSNPDLDSIKSLELKEIIDLKTQNYKSKVVEYCQLKGFDKPKMFYKQIEKYFSVYLVLDIESSQIQTKDHFNTSKKVAEQLAFKELLLEIIPNMETKIQEEIEIKVENDKLIKIDDSLKNELNKGNDKGNFIGKLTKYNLRLPHCQYQINTMGCTGFGVLKIDENGSELASEYYFGENKKLVEKAIYKDLSEKLDLNYKIEVPIKQVPKKVIIPSVSPQEKLNHLKQLGDIAGFSYEFLQRKGADHAPIFPCKIKLKIKNQEFDTDIFEAKSKKEAQLMASIQAIEIVNSELNL